MEVGPWPPEADRLEGDVVVARHTIDHPHERLEQHGAGAGAGLAVAVDDFTRGRIDEQGAGVCAPDVESQDHGGHRTRRVQRQRPDSTGAVGSRVRNITRRSVPETAKAVPSRARERA